jgi:hypothetical protein
MCFEIAEKAQSMYKNAELERIVYRENPSIMFTQIPEFVISTILRLEITYCAKKGPGVMKIVIIRLG